MAKPQTFTKFDVNCIDCSFGATSEYLIIT